jgi:hypothetical protein
MSDPLDSSENPAKKEPESGNLIIASVESSIEFPGILKGQESEVSSQEDAGTRKRGLDESVEDPVEQDPKKVKYSPEPEEEPEIEPEEHDEDPVNISSDLEIHEEEMEEEEVILFRFLFKCYNFLIIYEKLP